MSEISETVSAGQLRAFIERIEQIKMRQDVRRPSFVGRPYAIADRGVAAGHKPGPFLARKMGSCAGIGVKDAREMLAACGRLTWIGGASVEFQEERKGFTLACRLTGLPWQHIEKAMGDTRYYGPERAALAWAAYMKTPDERIVGYVYSAYAPQISGLVKIGFSRTPEKRMKALTRQHGCAVILGRTFAATMLHEWALHQILFRQPMPEWHRAEDVPQWLLPPQLVLGEAA